MTAITVVQAKPKFTITVTSDRLQTITGFGAASCFGAMEPYGKDTTPAKLLYGDESAIGLNIMRMEISPNFVGDVKIPEWGNWDTPYDWNGSLPSAKIVKERGGIVFGTPWSPQETLRPMVLHKVVIAMIRENRRADCVRTVMRSSSLG